MDGLFSRLHLHIAHRIVARVQVTIPQREVAAGDVYADVVTLLEHIARDL